MSLHRPNWRRLAESVRPKELGGLGHRLSSIARVRQALLGVATAAASSAAFFVRRPKADPTARLPVEDANSLNFLALSDLLGDLGMEHDANGRVLSVRGQAPGRIDPKTLLGAGFFNRLHVTDRTTFLHAFDLAARGEMAAVTLRVRTGAELGSAGGFDEPGFAWTEMRIRRLETRREDVGDARQAALISVTRDVSDLAEIRLRLDAARAEAALAISMKDRLLANVSHELRTPLNAILGFSEILSNVQLAPGDPAKRLEYAQIIHSSAEHLLSVVNLVLDMSKIEAGKFDIAPEPFELEPLVKDCWDMVRLKAENGRVTLSRVEKDFAVELVADKRACRQILLNLLSNAVKFTPPEGRVAIGAVIVGSMIHIHVADTGIGIAAKDLPRLGEAFFQVRSSYDRSYEGAGLGLSLVRGLVGLHGGTLCLESSPGVGTRVTVKLPLDCRLAAAALGATQRLETSAWHTAGTDGKVGPFENPSPMFRTEERKIA